MRTLILRGIAVVIVMTFAAEAYGEAKYLPGVLLIKFEDLLNKGGKNPFETQYPGVNTLNRKYGVTKIETMYPFLPKEPIDDPNGKWKWNHWEEAMEKYRLDTEYIIHYDPKYEPEEVAGAYRKCTGVVSVFPNYEGEFTYIPTDPLFPNQWHLHNVGQHPPGGTPDADIDAPEGWDYWPLEEQREAVIAQLDSGVQCYESYLYYGPHEDLVGNFWFRPGQTEPWPGRNFIAPGWPPNDIAGHGTMVAGVYGAYTDEAYPCEKGVAGVGYNETKILPLKTGNDYPELVWVCQAIVWGAQEGADVENMSFHFTFPEDPPPVLGNAVKFAYSLGVVMVASLDNNGWHNVPVYPAWYKEVIAVNATDEDDQKWINSGWGQETEFAAPGTWIWTTYMYADKQVFNPPKYGGDYSGTSFAAPIVSALAGLVQAWIYWETDPSSRIATVRDKLKNCCDDVNHWTYPGWDEWIGWGRVNLDKLADDLYGDAGDDGGRLASKAAPLILTAAVGPNPARGATTFRLKLPANAPVTEVEINIYDLAGRKVAVKKVTCPGEGIHEVAWDCASDKGSAVAPGVYIYRVTAGNNAVAGKVVVAR